MKHVVVSINLERRESWKEKRKSVSGDWEAMSGKKRVMSSAERGLC